MPLSFPLYLMKSDSSSWIYNIEMEEFADRTKKFGDLLKEILRGTPASQNWSGGSLYPRT